MVTRYYNCTVYIDPFTKVHDIYVDDTGLIVRPKDWLKAFEVDSVDLGGGTLIPSFRDTHIHPILGGREALGLNVRDAKTTEELGLKLRDHFLANPDLTWLDAGTYNRGITGEITASTLDGYVDTIPVILHADDHHTIWVNSKALELAGINDSNLPSFTTGGIETSNGKATGILKEEPAKDLVLQHAPKPTLAEDVQALLKAEDLLIAAGITEVQDAWVDESLLEVYLAGQKLLKLDYKLAFALNPQRLAQDFDFITKALATLESTTSISAHAVKIFIDGVFGSATAAVSEPYLSTGENGDLNWSVDGLDLALDFTQKQGLQSHMHAIGDAAVEFALDAIEKHPGLDALIAHAELTNPKLLNRINDLKVKLSVQPFWAQNNDLLLTCEKHLGLDRINSVYAFKDMIDLEVPIAFSSDWPVSSHAPLDGIRTAVFRRFSADQVPHNPAQSVSVEQALGAYTSAATNLLRSGKGELSVGSYFDAVLLNKDLMQQDLEGFDSLEVLATFKDGRKLLPHNDH